MTVLLSRRTVLALLAAVAGALLTLLSAAPATGHATLIGTDPADGDVLPAPPTLVTLTFNERVQATDDGVRLLDATGEPLQTSAASVDDTVELSVPADLPDGSYIVDWRVTSADGHPVSGAFTFGVGAPSEAPTAVTLPASSPLVDVLQQAGQVLVYVGILGTSGLVIFRFLLLDPAAGAVRSRIDWVTAVLAAVAVVGLVLFLAADGAWRAGTGPSGLVDPELLWSTLTSTTGLATGVGAAGLAVALSAGGGRAGSAALACGGAVLALLSLPLTGHTRSYGPAWLVLGSDVLHVVAGSVWVGGVLGLLLTLRSSAPAPAAARTVTRFSSAAAWVVLALAVSGTLLAWRIMPGLGTLTTTGYGVTLLAKVAAVACIVAIAAWNRSRLVPAVVGEDDGAAASSRLRRTVGAEAGLMLVVLALTGVLVSQSPTEADEAAATPTEPVTRHEPLGDDATVRVEVRPAVTGENTIELALTDADGAPLEPAADPQLRLQLPDVGLGPLVPEVASAGPGTYEVVVDIPLAGEWELEVSARTSTYEHPVAVVPLEVAPAG